MNLAVCNFPGMEYESILDIVTEALGETGSCSADGQAKQVSQEEIEETSEKLSRMFDSDGCWKHICPESFNDDAFNYESYDDFYMYGDDFYDHGDGYDHDHDDGYDHDHDYDHGDAALDTFLYGLVIDHITTCANIDLTDETCLDLTLRDMLLGGGSSGTNHDYGSPAASNSMAPIRRNLQRKLYNSSSSTPKNNKDFIGEFGHEDYAAYTYEEPENPTCEVPDVDVASIDFFIEMSKGKCTVDGKEVDDATIQNAIETFTALFGATHCWESLCHEETLLMLIADYMEKCADIDLPFLSGPDHIPSPDDDIVGCMIDFVMSTPNSEFGLPLPEQTATALHSEGSHDHCYPPGHYDVKNLCPSNIAPIALKHCTGMGRPDIPPPGNYYGSMSYQYGDFDDWGWGEDLFFEDQFFFSMSMSMSMSIDYSSGDDDKPPKEDPDRDARLMEDFCIILDQLSSDKGKQCLLPLCGIEGEAHNYDDGDADGENESIPPSSMPSTSPSAMPSVQPSVFPSTAPSSTPSLAPSADPSTAPSSTPSLAPSAAPSTAPSSTPSLAPSAAPSLLPTPEAVTNGVVEIRYEAAIKVDNLDISAIPLTPGEELNKIVDVLKEVLSQFLPANSVARILSIGGIPVASPIDRRLRRYRLLQAAGGDADGDTDVGVEIEFEVISTLECEDAECSDADAMSQEAYSVMTTDINEAVSEGTLTTAIQEQASEANVEVLAAIEINSFTAEEPTVTITEGEDDSAAPKAAGIAVAAIVSSIAGLVLCGV